ncbi:MAG TPA: hypothetical protein VJT54_02520 [Verrucomicrobiae bacterium]|nr:hypothetical protein [Verrucomicrobiae bacterium]
MKHAVLLTVALFALNLRAADTRALTLVRTIPLPDVRGRIDHLALDAAGQRLFVAALGNDTVEVVDLAAGRRVRTIGDCSEPQGLAFVPAENRLVIANGGSGVVRILDATSFKTIKAVTGLPDADNVRYDAKSDLIYIGYGEGALAVIKAATGEQVANLTLAGHPESFQIERYGSRIFVNVPEAQQVAVVDRDRHGVVATWPMEEFQANFPMALDEANHRLFVGCRRPARLVVLDTTTGKMVDSVKLAGDTDDLFYDADRKQIYASGGAGFIDVIEQRSSDSYRLREQVPTPGGARTSYFWKERSELYLAVRAGLISGGAEIRVYQCR